MGIRRKVSIGFGAAQSIMGSLATVFAYLLYYNFLDMQTVLSVPQKDVVLYMLVLIVFGLLSIIGGLFLISGNND
jgi:hypothetical protein